MLVVVKGVAVLDLCVDAADRQVHHAQPPRGVVRLLPVDRDVADPPLVRLDELLALHKHAARPTARIVDAPLIGSQHLDEHPHDVCRRVELTALLALGARKLGQEVLVHTAQHVLGAVLGVAQPDVRHQVDQLSQPLLVEPGPRIVLGQHALKRGVLALDGEHGVVHQLADHRLPGVGLELRPARLRRHPEDVEAHVLVAVLRVGPGGLLGRQLRILFLKGVGDVLQEDQPEHHVLVLGRVHVRTQGIGGAP